MYSKRARCKMLATRPEYIQDILISPKCGVELEQTLLPPSAVPHISHPPVPKSRGMTASPRGEKPCPLSDVFQATESSEIFCQRLLPRGRHPRVASLAPSGQFTSSCQKSALRNRFLTDVGDRRRRLCNLLSIRKGPVTKFATAPF